jgi:transcriptional regulator with XRE-family HTH domain
MGRPPLYPDQWARADRGGPRWTDPTFCDWSAVIGDRIQRLRRARDWTLGQIKALVPRPDGGGEYSHGYISRIERGYARAPLYVYLHIANALEVHPGRLMGLDDSERDATPDEMTLVEYVRLAGITPAQAIHVLSTR